MSARTAARRRQIAARLIAGAFAWSVGLVCVALFAPIYDSSTVAPGDDGVTLTRSTLVQVNGLRALALMVIPAVASLVVAAALRSRWAGSRWSTLVAWVAVLVLVGEAVLGILTIGIFSAPVAVVLAAAIRLSSGTTRRASPDPQGELAADARDEPAPDARGELAAGT